MIKAVTFQAAQNFKANLYALELKSRFIDQTKANGFYKGYGSELSHTVSGTSAIIINSGAFLVQGRAIEIVSSESVGVVFENGKVGYIVARIETKPADNVPNCTLVAKTGATLSGITLTQQDVYQYSAESENKIYELPLYSFGMQNNAIQNVQKLILPIEEITTIKQTADAALAIMNNLLNKTYPVGAVYISINNTSPASLFGGTWAAFGAGCALVGVNSSDTAFDSVEKTGGAKTHTLNTSEIPSHTHSLPALGRPSGYMFYLSGMGRAQENTSSGIYVATASMTSIITPDYVGGGAAHNNLQPYITVYMWKRVS